MARRVGFARASEHINAHVGSKELLTLFTEGDALVTMTAFDGLELAAVSAGGTTFDQVVFKSCVFEDVDFSRCTFADVSSWGAGSSRARWSAAGSTGVTSSRAPLRA